MLSQAEKIQKLKDYFAERDDVVMAFLFGSRAKEAAHAHSDWDIAVYFKTGGKAVLWEESDEKELKYFEERRGISRDCANILETDKVDVVVLNNAAATLADETLKGDPLIIKNKGLWLEFMIRVTSAARDFRELAKGYFEIFWRSASLSPEDAFSLNRRLTFVENEMNVLKDYQKLTLEDYKSDLAKQSIVERSIEKIMNALIDASKIILASRRKPIPEKYREIVQTVGFINPFSPDNTEVLSRCVDLRNFLAHEYLDYRWKEIKNFLKNALPALEKFVQSSKKFLQKNESLHG